MGWLAWLFDQGEYVTRNHCGTGWTPQMVRHWQVSNLAIAAAYFAIPAVLAVLYTRRRDALPRPTMLLLFIAFITLCGTTHVTEVLVFDWVPYRLFTLVYDLTAAVSVTTAVLLPSVVRYLLALPTPAEYERAVAQKDRALADLGLAMGQKKERIRRLAIECDTLRETVEHLKWRTVKEDEYHQLRERIHAIRNAAS